MSTEQENAPRITPEHIESKILSKNFFTASQAVYGRNKIGFQKVDGKFVPYCDNVKDGALSTLTFCVLVLENGFTVTGESACVSVANFDPKLGEDIAYKKAIDKIWMLEGYLLKEKLA